ncbi:MAG: G1 family glutamic endopeptidase, partial [Candidatus Limnocylindrales bacterium]
LSAGRASSPPTPALTPSPSPTASPSVAPAGLHAGCPPTAATNPASPGQTALHVATTNWSGYVARSSKAFSCIEGSWTLPRLTCPTAGSASLSIWVGFDGEEGPSRATLEQIGTNSDCSGGQARTFAWFEILPRDRFERVLDLDLSVGDRIQASIEFVGRSYHLVIEDLTSGAVADTLERSPNSRRLTAEWIVEAPTVGCPNACHVASLLRFSPISFSQAHSVLAGRTGPIADGRWTRVRLDLESKSGLVKARAGTLSKDGTTFSVVWHHR